MSVLVPIIRCSLTWEQYNTNNQIIKKDVYKLVDFGLSRNEFREIQFEVTLLGKESLAKTKVPHQQSNGQKVLDFGGRGGLGVLVPGCLGGVLPGLSCPTLGRWPGLSVV